MEPNHELAARLDADRREAAEQLTPGQRVLAGPAMFDVAMMMMRAGIRMQNRLADEETIEQIVLDRLRNARRYEPTV